MQDSESGSWEHDNPEPTEEEEEAEGESEKGNGERIVEVIRECIALTEKVTNVLEEIFASLQVTPTYKEKTSNRIMKMSYRRAKSRKLEYHTEIKYWLKTAHTFFQLVLEHVESDPLNIEPNSAKSKRLPKKCRKVQQSFRKMKTRVKLVF